uniref:Programmed cell death protein 4 n=1 Tax=Meloidogyne javanica TaxID=6303 RepID=A0A915MDX0_MELJA
MDASKQNCSHKNHHNIANKQQKDPELEAEIRFAKASGAQPPRILPSDAVKNITEVFENHCVSSKNLIKNLKNGRAERKARSRGVSGCAIKNDGNRFEYGLDCIDLAYENDNQDKTFSSDSEEEYDEYADFVRKYSDEEIRQIMRDYLENGNLAEALDSLEKFALTKDMVHKMIKDILMVTIENSVGSYDMTANMLAEMVNKKWVSFSAIADILEDIVGSVGDISKDVPKASESLAILMAKLVEHNLCTLNILNMLASKHSSDAQLVKSCYEDAVTFANNHHLLMGKCAPCGGQNSTEVLSEQFKHILKEYLNSNDKEAATQRLSDLRVPHFNHEFVYKAGIFALEEMHDHVMDKLAILLKDLSDKGTLAESCIEKGFKRLFNDLADLYLDLPAAYVLAQRWVSKTAKIGVISQQIVVECPRETIRSRSRTLSEGPDGKLIVDNEKSDDDFNKDDKTSGYSSEIGGAESVQGDLSACN